MQDTIHTFIKFLFKTSIVVMLGFEFFAGSQLSDEQFIVPGIIIGAVIYKFFASPLVEGVDRFVDRFRSWIAQAS